jgi:uncharacterized membrane protein HdeD (DUF308 family)
MTDVRQEDMTSGGTPRAGAGWAWILAYGVLSAVLGVFAFLAPFPATLAATLVVGAFLFATGVMALAAGVIGRDHHHRLYKVLLGVLSIIVGLVMAFRPLTGAFSLTLLLAAWLGARGVMEIIWGARHERHRWSMIAMGVLNLLLASFIVATVPFSALTLPGFVLGTSLLFGGVMAIAAGLAHKKGAPAFSLAR